MGEPLWETGALFAGKYRIEEVLGHGGMGIVLGARHERLDEPVAIKVLLPAMMETPGVVDRFVREARAAAKIKSEHVVRVTDVDTLPSGVPFIVMERLEGSDLAMLVKQKTVLPIEDAVRWVIEACNAVAEAHARGIVHRDLKPGNLFLARRSDGSSAIKVLDFGISKLSSDDGEHAVTAAGVALGSPSYMSPEQMRSARDVDARTDIWALGAVLFRLLTGRTPFRADNFSELCTLVTNATLQRPSELRPDIPAALDAVLLRCLEKDPKKRPASVAELAEALLPFAGEGAPRKVRPVSIPAIAPLERDEPTLDAPEPSNTSSGLRPSEHGPACDRSGATRAENRAGLETSDSGPQMTSALRARMESEAPSDEATPRPPIGARRSTARTLAIAGVLALLAAGAGIRVVHRAAGPSAASAPPTPVRSLATAAAAGAVSAAPTAVPSLANAAPPGVQLEPLPAPSSAAAASASHDASASSTMGVPAATAIAPASAPAPPALSGPLPWRKPMKKSRQPDAPMSDPFGGGRK